MRIWSNLNELLDRLVRKPRRLERELQVTTVIGGAVLLNILQSHASGRPGPEVETGAFRDAMTVVVNPQQHLVIGYNPSPEAARLEHGFVGRDSLGRLYHQPPYSWLLPSQEEFAPIWEEMVVAATKRAMS